MCMKKVVGLFIIFFVACSFFLVFVARNQEDNMNSGFDFAYDLGDVASSYSDNLTYLVSDLTNIFSNITPFLNYLSEQDNLPNFWKIALTVVFPFDLIIYPVMAITALVFGIVKFVGYTVRFLWDIGKVASVYGA